MAYLKDLQHEVSAGRVADRRPARHRGIDVWGVREARVTRREHNGMIKIREDGPDLIEVHVAAVCIRVVRGRWKLLAARRTEERSLFHGNWECGGGQVRTGEDFQAAIKRQIFEEFGLEIEPYSLVGDYSIHIPERQRVIPGVRYLCLAKDGAVRLNRREFDVHRWVNFPVPPLDWIGGLKETLDSIQLPDLPEGAGKPRGSKRAPGFIDTGQ